MNRTGRPAPRLRHVALPAALILGGLACQPSRAAAPLRYLETDKLRLVYFDPQLTYLVPHAGRCFENSMLSQQKILGFKPSEKVTVLLADFADRGNAAAGAVPRNMLQFEVSPMDFTLESFVAPERMYMLMNHELVHVATTDMTARSDRAFRKLFLGKVRPIDEHPESMLYHYLTSPRNAAPRWFKEGIAVFNETWMAGGIGRAQGSYDEMVFRSMVRDNSHFYDPLGLVSEGVRTDFQLQANSYLYGTRFMSYLAWRESPEHLVRWVSRTEGSKRYFASQFRQVFGASVGELWQDWIEWEHEFQQANLEKIRQYPVTPHRDLSERALGSVSRAHLDAANGKLYVAFNYPGVVSHVGAISIADGSVERIIEIKQPAGYGVTSLAFDPDGRRLFYTVDHRALRDLRVVDPETRQSRTLIKDARVGDLVYNRQDRSIWGLRYLNGIVTLVRIPEPYEEWNQVRSWPYGEVPYDLDISPDGTLVAASVAELSGRHALHVWKLEDLGHDELTPVAEVDFGTTIPMNFVFSGDGGSLYGSTYYTGVANVFRYVLASGELQALTNTETGLFRPIPREDGSLIAFRFTGEGFVPALLDDLEVLEDINAITFLGQQTIARHPALEQWRVESPADVPLEELVLREGEYKSYRNIGLESMYPVIEGYKDSLALGLQFNLSDYFSLIEASASASYTPDEDIPSDERLHLEAKFKRRNWRARAALNDADFYDLFGPTEKSLKGYSVGVGYNRLLVWDQPRELRLTADLTLFGDLERLPDYQNVSVGFDRLLTAEVELHFENLRASLGHVDAEKGFQWDLVGAANHVNGETIPSLRVDWDVGWALPLHHSSLWLRTSLGRAFGDIDDPFANFFFGGFGNNWVDRGTIKRYREHYAFPGLELNEVGGRTFTKAMLEWNLPPLRFRRVGTPGFYLTWARTSLFAGGLVTNPEEPSRRPLLDPLGNPLLDPLGNPLEEKVRRTLRNVGAQIDFRFTALSNLDMTLSLGYATAFESGEDSSDEFMVSLKILH